MTEIEAANKYLSQALKRYEAENFGLEYLLRMETERRVKAESELKQIKNRVRYISQSPFSIRPKMISNLNQELK